MDLKIARLALEDGTIVDGTPFGASGVACFELVFNTSQTGYQEIITDPSYRGQGVVFTVSHIGNVGVNLEDLESTQPQVSAVVVRSLSPVVSNWRANQPLPDWLRVHEVPGISDVDTRFLTRKLRDQGAMKAALSTLDTPPQELVAMARAWPGLEGLDMVRQVTCPEPYLWHGDPGSAWVPPRAENPEVPRIVLYDYGAKRNILRQLAAQGMRIWVVPADYPAQDVLNLKPDGVMLSNGPGDPAGLPYAVKIVKELIQQDVPIFGICLGHQLIGRALGGETQKLKFGHHGGNHPVQNLSSKAVFITAQNHNYTVVPESLPLDQVEITHLSLNDQSVEGLRMRSKPVFSVQYHPEAAPGPHDAHGLFEAFLEQVLQNMQKRA